MTDLLTTKQVAELKGVTVKTVNIWAQNGWLPVAHTESTGARLYDPEVVRTFTTNQKAAS